MKKVILSVAVSLSLMLLPSMSYADTKDDLQSSRDKLNELSNKMIENTLKRDELDEKISTNESKIGELSDSIKDSEDKIAKRKEDLGNSIRSEQLQSNKNSLVDVILSGESATDIIKGIFAKTTIAEAKNNKIKNITDIKEDLEKNVKDLNKEKEDLAKNKEDLDKVTDDLENQESTLKGNIEELESKYAKEIAEENKITTAVQETQQKVLDLPTGSAVKGNTDTKAQSSIIATASQFIGVPYVFGGSSPSGFDCSGFTSYVFSLHGVSLPRVASDQSLVGTAVSLDDLQVGDLVFWGGVGSAYHVGIYAGNNTYIHAPTEGETVKYASMDYYRPDSARRVF